MASEMTWSYSRLSCYLNCSLQFFFRYLTEIEETQVSANLILGSGVHLGHEMIYSGMKQGKLPTLKEVKEGVEEDIRIREHISPKIKYCNGDGLEKLVAQAMGLTEVLYDSVKPETVLAVDHREVVDLVDHRGKNVGRIQAVYDLVVQDGEREIICDLKTAKQKLSESRITWDLQPTIYQAIRQVSTGKLPGFRYDVLYKKKTPEFDSIPVFRGQDDFERLFAIIRGVHRGVRHAVYIPNRGSMFCASCGYEPYCMNWPL